MFKSAWLKHKRAQRHIDDVAQIFTDFANANPHRLSKQADPQTGSMSVRIKFGEDIPDEIALSIGDAIHNLRSALDHMTWELVGRDNGTQNRYLKLPTGDNRRNFESSCQGMVTPTQAVKDIFKGLEVFPGGDGQEIYNLHLLDNADKHTVLVPVIRATTLSKIVILKSNGTVAAKLTNITLIGGNTPYTNVASIAPGLSVELDEDTRATPDLFFSKVEGAPAEPVVPSLQAFSRTVDAALRKFENQARGLLGE